MKQQQSVFLDDEVLNAVAEKADKDLRSLSFTINAILKKFFKLK